MSKKIFVTFFAFLSLTMPVSAQTKNWEKLLHDGQQALKANDYSYAIYKLRQSWLAVPDQNLHSEPYNKIRRSFASAFARAGNIYGQRISQDAFPIEELDNRLRLRERNNYGDQFNVELQNNGTLALFAVNHLYRPTTGYCATGQSSYSAQDWKNLELAVKDQAEHQKQLMAKMPIKVLPGSCKYDELLVLCQPITPGKRKKLGFDVNPFIPDEFKTTPDL